MDYSAIIPYFIAVVALTAAPGPLMAALVVRSLSRDTEGAAAFAAGLCIGDVIAVVAVALGLGVWAQSMPGLLSLGKYLGVAYLLWLAVGIWNNRSNTSSSNQQKSGLSASAAAGTAICLGNPATLLTYMILLPIIVPEGFASIQQIAAVSLVTLTAVGMVFFGTIVLARQLNGIIASPSSSLLFGRITAGTLALTSVWMLAA
jgi:threonine/homoserine/homoserine lactone efflux protein